MSRSPFPLGSKKSAFISVHQRFLRSRASFISVVRAVANPFSVSGFFCPRFDFSVKYPGPVADTTGDGADRPHEA
jgi:hypothetical protein